MDDCKAACLNAFLTCTAIDWSPTEVHCRIHHNYHSEDPATDAVPLTGNTLIQPDTACLS